MNTRIGVRGNVSAEELAAVLAVVYRATGAVPREPTQDGYDRWRSGRLRAMRLAAPPR